MKIKPSEGNKTFCIAPWTHTYLSPQSERRLCCASREKASWASQYIDSEKSDKNSKYTPVSLDEHWNSPYMMDIRKKLMENGEKYYDYRHNSENYFHKIYTIMDT